MLLGQRCRSPSSLPGGSHLTYPGESQTFCCRVGILANLPGDYSTNSNLPGELSSPAAYLVSNSRSISHFWVPGRQVGGPTR